ncbi:hypothetical protein HK096_008923 [Nowakowskiella sp. JEL0078]|nr:hypothetical protein HK096_008923 [Nowakowskiella sp. JEL0078]
MEIFKCYTHTFSGRAHRIHSFNGTIRSSSLSESDSITESATLIPTSSLTLVLKTTSLSPTPSTFVNSSSLNFDSLSGPEASFFLESSSLTAAILIFLFTIALFFAVVANKAKKWNIVVILSFPAIILAFFVVIIRASEKGPGAAALTNDRWV